MEYARRAGKYIGRPKKICDREKVRTLHQQGLSTREIAADVGACHMTVQRVLSAKGFESEHGWSAEDQYLFGFYVHRVLRQRICLDPIYRHPSDLSVHFGNWAKIYRYGATRIDGYLYPAR